MKESVFLREMGKLVDDGDITLGEISEKLRSKGLVFLTLVCILPFMQPIPIPGLSTLLGFVIILQGIGLAFIGRPLLTKRMREVRLPADKVSTFIKGARKIFPWIGWMVRPRGEAWVHSKTIHLMAGLVLIALSLFLSLPLPLPSSNFLPAIGIFFICLGLLEDDLLLVILGMAYAVLFGWLISISFHVLWAELSDSSWWNKYF